MVSVHGFGLEAVVVEGFAFLERGFKRDDDSAGDALILRVVGQTVDAVLVIGGGVDNGQHGFGDLVSVPGFADGFDRGFEQVEVVFSVVGDEDQRI